MAFSLYSTLCDSISVPSSSTNVTVYWFTVLLNCAVYVASPVTSSIAGLQPVNV